MKLLVTTTLTAILFLFSKGAQAQRDQDLITLKNGYQALGYLIEQKPGQYLKIYRPIENDTLTIQMNEIDKLSKIIVQSYAPQKMAENDTIIEYGKYNNKKHILQMSYVNWNNPDVIGSSFSGFGFAIYRNFKNQYNVGIGLNYTSAKGTNVYLQNRHFQIMAESKIRLRFFKPQNARITTQFGLGLGYGINHQETYKSSGIIDNTKMNDFIIQSSLSIKLNTDFNSGFIIEPGLGYHNPFIKNYDDGGHYLGIQKEFINHSPLYLTLRLSYFF